MNRRQFLIETATILMGLEAFAKVNYDKTFEADVLELVGKKRPELGDYNLRKKVSEAFADMKETAKKSGIKIDVVSSYRDFDHQKMIWNRKYNNYSKKGVSQTEVINKIIRYSSIPGTSRHHWGTDLDVADLSLQSSDPLETKNFESGGVYQKLGSWIKENSKKYGFYVVYTKDPKRTGFKYEPWHISFAELSIPMLKQYMDMRIEKYLIHDSVRGSKNFSKDFIIKYKNEYMMGVNPLFISKDTFPNR